MKISLKDLQNSQASLIAIGSVPINSAMKFRLARVIKQVESALQEVNEAQIELFKREGGVTADGRRYQFPTPETGKKVADEYAELVKEEVEIKFDRFSEDTFEKLNLSSVDIANTLWLFGDEEKKLALVPEQERESAVV